MVEWLGRMMAGMLVVMMVQLKVRMMVEMMADWMVLCKVERRGGKQVGSTVMTMVDASEKWLDLMRAGL